MNCRIFLLLVTKFYMHLVNTLLSIFGELFDFYFEDWILSKFNENIIYLFS
jgi:hypothetical protein